MGDETVYSKLLVAAQKCYRSDAWKAGSRGRAGRSEHCRLRKCPRAFDCANRSVL